MSMTELRSNELPVGTALDVEVRGDGTFFVRVYYRAAVGESRGATTFTEGVRLAIENAGGRVLERKDETDIGPAYYLSAEARAGLARAAADLGIPPAAVLDQLAARVEVERLGRLALSPEPGA